MCYNAVMNQNDCPTCRKPMGIPLPTSCPHCGHQLHGVELIAVTALALIVLAFVAGAVFF
jgi:hypothetical protein